jgi:uncharacterized protein YjbJ (UPF0337 family)
MNWTQLSGKWDQMKGDVKSNWGKLTDDDMSFIGGKFDNLVGKLVERYGMKKEQAEKQIAQWVAHVGDKLDASNRAVQEQRDEQSVPTKR